MLLTLGLFLLVVNAALLGLTAAITDRLTIDGFGTAVIGGLVAAVALLCIFHFTKPKPKKRKPVLAVDFDEVCVGYLAAFIEFNNETYGTTLVFADFETCALSRFDRPPSLRARD